MCNDMRDWLSTLKENITVFDDCTGEKAEVSNRLEKLKVRKFGTNIIFLIFIQNSF